LLQELAGTGKQNTYSHEDIVEIIAQRIGYIYESEYIKRVIYKTKSLEIQKKPEIQLTMFENNA
jgi:hypothetical protein